MNRTARNARRASLAPAAAPEITAAAPVATDVPPAAEEAVSDAETEVPSEASEPAESEAKAPTIDAPADPATEIDPATADREAEQSPAAGPKRWLKMKIGISGTEYSLSPGWKYAFCDQPGPDGEPSEAQRLVDAKYAVDTDPPADD